MKSTNNSNKYLDDLNDFSFLFELKCGKYQNIHDITMNYLNSYNNSNKRQSILEIWFSAQHMFTYTLQRIYHCIHYLHFLNDYKHIIGQETNNEEFIKICKYYKNKASLNNKDNEYELNIQSDDMMIQCIKCETFEILKMSNEYQNYEQEELWNS